MNKATRELLEAHFDTAFAAPDGIKKLRELILTLAMQGKLVAQDPNDSPASQLLKEIEAEKKRLVKEGKIKAPKPLPEIKPEEVPYALPQSWEWVRMEQLFDIVYGKGLATSELTIEGFDVFGANGIIGKYSSYLYEEPQLLISCRGAYSGKPNISPPHCFVTSNSLVIQNSWQNLSLRFYFYALKIANKEKIVTGSAQPQVTTTNLAPFVIPLPPFAEQHRIVAKIDQLIARCDELEKLRDEREQKRRSVYTAALKQLLDASLSSPPRRRGSSDLIELDSRLRGNDNSFADAWQFITLHFGELYADKKNVAELHKAILQLAVMGKLVPQNPNDPPASQLLKGIEAEKKRLVKEGKIKAPKPLPEIKPEEVPYALPQGWEWVRLGEIGISQTGTTPPSKDAENLGDFIPFIGPGDIKNNVINYSGDGLSEIGLSNGRLIEKNSVLMVCIGGSIGKHAVNDRDVTCNQQINTLTPYKPVSVNFVFYSMGAEWFQKNVVAQAGGSATPIINKQKWSSILVPLPPTFEQHRIVAKIDSLISLCDTLEQQIDAATRKQNALLDAVMAQV